LSVLKFQDVRLVLPDHVCGTLCRSASVSLTSPWTVPTGAKTHLFETVSAGPSDFLFLGVDYK